MTDKHDTAADFAALSRFQHLRRLALFAMLAVAVALLLFCSSRPAEGDLHHFVEAVGLSLIGAAIMGRLWCTLYIGGRKGAEIVEQGPYSVTRNPLYVFSAIGAAGVGAQTGSITIAALFALATAAAFHVVILREEAYLDAAFGHPYAAYRARVPRFFPDFRLYSDAGELTVIPRLLYSTFFDGLVFFLAFPGFEFIEWLQEAGVLPVLLRLP